MSFSNSTPNYNLPQYTADDKPAFLSDFNNAMDKIDTALHENNVDSSSGSSELQSALIVLNDTKNEVDTAIGQINQLEQQTENLIQEATNVTQNATNALNTATESKTESAQAVTIASQASTTANSALGVANSNYTEIQSLDARVEALEDGQTPPYDRWICFEESISLNVAGNYTSASGTATLSSSNKSILSACDTYLFGVKGFGDVLNPSQANNNFGLNTSVSLNKSTGVVTLTCTPIAGYRLNNFNASLSSIVVACKMPMSWS